jgi:hypothetical protein
VDKGQRPIDLICAGMYRACSTWQYEVAAHLIEREFGGSRLGYLTSEQYADLIRSDAGGDEAVPRPAWRVFKSHEGHPCFQRALAQRRALVLYAYRDVREVVFSLMHKRGLTFEQLLRQGMLHQILANDRFWRAQPGVLIQRYEDLIADPATGVLALAGHLGIALTESEAAGIAEEYSVDSNRARTEILRKGLEQVGVNLDDDANAQICDSSTLLHWNHIRPRGTGSWTTQATPAHRVVLHRLCRRWLRARNYPLYPINEQAGHVVLPSLDPRQRIRIELDLIVAQVAQLAQTISRLYPRLVRAVKRLVGIQTPARVGASVWRQSKTDGSESSVTVEKAGT